MKTVVFAFLFVLLINQSLGIGEEGSHEEEEGAIEEGDQLLEEATGADMGHAENHQFTLEEKKRFGEENHKHQFIEEGGSKKKQSGGHGTYGEHFDTGKGSKGGKYDNKKGHKKGSSTTGYHKKTNKDEYHKDNKFYDKDHKGGHHHKYGKEHEYYNKKEDANKKGGYYESSHKKGNKGDYGQYDKGRFDEFNQGHDKKHGQSNHFNHHEDFGNKGVKKDNHWFGFQKVD